MAKIIYKKKYKTYISQTLSALIIIGAITVSYLPIDMNYYMADIIVERLHEEGIVSDAILGSKPREVLVRKENKENDKKV